MPNIAEIGLQFGTATAQLRVVSTFPEAQREGQIQKAIDNLEGRFSGMQEQIQELNGEMQSLRTATENRLKAAEAGYEPSEFLPGLVS